MSGINCIIADDEALAREVIKQHISKISWLNLTACCTNGLETFAAIKNSQPDLLFLDIQMPLLTGIELLKTLKTPPPVIITTAHREFALEGYELNVLDYLLKPISFERFLKAVDKYETWAKPIQRSSIYQWQQPDNDAFIYVKSDKKNVRVLLSDILYIEGLKDYVKIHTRNRSIITHQTLTYFEEKLSADHFIRSHRSFIIALYHIHTFSASQIEIGKVSLPIGSAYAKQVLLKLNEK
jgi:DNA-binding LytR/AlgR family response regulator